MKKLGLVLVITCLVIGTVFAQNQEKERRSPPQSITVEGTLQLQNGMIAIKSGETVYYVPMLQRYVGFIEALKEGNTISVEGYAFKNFLRPTKVALGGKTYDFPNAGPGQRTASAHRHEAKPQLRHGHHNKAAPRHMGYSKHNMRHGPRHKTAPEREPVRRPGVRQEKVK